MDNQFNENRKLYKFLRNAAIFFGIVLMGIGLGAMVFFGSLSDIVLAYISFVLAMLSLLVGIVLAFTYHKNVYVGDKRQHRPLLVCTLFVGVVLPIYFFWQWTLFQGGELAIILGCFIFAALLFFIYRNKVKVLEAKNVVEQDEENPSTQMVQTGKGEDFLEKQGLKLPRFAIIMEAVSIGLLLLAFNGVSFSSEFGMAVGYSALIAPFVGIILGFHCLFTRRENGGSAKRKTLSLIAILLPFACVALILALGSQGIWLIRFM